MTAGVFERGYVLEQLRCLGLLATCKVLKAGLPTRIHYCRAPEKIWVPMPILTPIKGLETAHHRNPPSSIATKTTTQHSEHMTFLAPTQYSELRSALSALPASTQALFRDQPEATLVGAALWGFEIPPDTYQLGRTRVFLKAGQISRVEEIMRAKLGPAEMARVDSRVREAVRRRVTAMEAIEALSTAQDGARESAAAARDTESRANESVAALAAEFGECEAELRSCETGVADADKSVTRARTAADATTRLAATERAAEPHASACNAAAADAHRHAESARAALAIVRAACDTRRTNAESAAKVEGSVAAGLRVVDEVLERVSCERLKTLIGVCWRTRWRVSQRGSGCVRRPFVARRWWGESAIRAWTVCGRV